MSSIFSVPIADHDTSSVNINSNIPGNSNVPFSQNTENDNGNGNDSDDSEDDVEFPNSIFDLVKNVNYKRKSTTTGLLAIQSTPTVVSLKGPTSNDIPPIKLSRVHELDPEHSQEKLLKSYIKTLQNDDIYQNFHESKSLTLKSLKKLSSTGNLNHISIEEHEANLDSNDLKIVPDFYFDDDFRLDNPRIFKKVLNNSSFLSIIDGKGEIVDHEAIQDQLSSYLDIVEVHLIHEISKSSHNFFSALDDLKSINKSSETLTIQLQNVDNHLSILKSNKILHSKDLLKLTQKVHNIQRFNQILLQIKTILNQATVAESYYFESDYDKCIQIVDSVFALIKGNIPSHPMVDKLTADWKFPINDLNKLPALIPLKRLLSNLISDTGKSYAKLFSNLLIDDLRYTYENFDTHSILKQLLNVGNANNTNSNNVMPKFVTNEFELKLKQYLVGLTRCGELASAYRLYQERLSTELKLIYKSNLPSDKPKNSISSNRSDDSKSTNVMNNISNALILSDLIKNMTPKEFEMMLVDDYTKFHQAFYKLTIHKNLILTTSIDVLNNFDPQILKTQPDMIMDLDITNSMNASINSIQHRMAKLIKIREQQNAFIPLNYFLRFYKLNKSFITECELVSKGMIDEPILKEVNNRQLNIFIQQFHRGSLKRCTDIIESEVWKVDGLKLESQEIVDFIIKASEGNLENSDWNSGLNIDFEDKLDNPIDDSSTDPPEHINSGDKEIVDSEVRKTLDLHSQSYTLPSSVGYILGSIKAYLLLIHHFKNSFISQNYLPELLKSVNWKIHQSVLGAQATRTAGLKRVTTRHLALAAEVCRFWGTILFDIERVCLSEFSITNEIQSHNDGIEKTRTNIMKEFEEVRNQFFEQVNDIYDKLVAVIGDTITTIVDKVSINDFLKKLPDHEEDPHLADASALESNAVEAHNETKENDVASDQLNVNLYIEVIVKNTLTIARSVQRYLPMNEYDTIMKRIAEKNEGILSQTYQRIISSAKEEQLLMIRKQMLVDIDFFVEKLNCKDDDYVNRLKASVEMSSE